MKKLYKKFGEAENKDCYTLQTTSWDGMYPVLVIFPKKITKNLKDEVEDFLLSELDAHDDLDKFRFLCDIIETAKARKRNLEVENEN